MKKDISIIIPSYNTKEITTRCVKLLSEALSKESQNSGISYEILVVDNASTDGSAKILNTLPVKPVLLKQNVGFSKANNVALQKAKGEFILFMNSDVYLTDTRFRMQVLLDFLKKSSTKAALTVRLELEDGTLDRATHRGFPTIWNSLCYFLKLETVAQNFLFFRRIFGGYHLLYKDLSKVHTVDVISGAFFLVKKSVLDDVGAFDEDFFMYGEDIDLAYRIKQAGYQIFFYPYYKATHLKYKSGIGTSDEGTKRRITSHFYTAMKIFYRKHYEQKYHPFVNAIVYAVISLKTLDNEDTSRRD